MGPILSTEFITTITILTAQSVTRLFLLFYFLMLAMYNAMYNGQTGLFLSKTIFFFLHYVGIGINFSLYTFICEKKKHLHSATKFILLHCKKLYFLLMKILDIGLYSFNEPILNFETLTVQNNILYGISFYFAVKLSIIYLTYMLSDTYGEAYYSTSMLCLYGLVRINMELLPHVHSIFFP
ncbi:hypothetical protein Ahy_A03g015468 isoform B [Arachis hypogaea]|uniref:NADH:quinone oxidoreductase/Mrp antiporter membrane subunit domain-containing protein n=1 Tax=Arachis hypogaea TaxID=3818 RepID=A0A445E0L6_ARAHY|nr:hypothetical protein Ahy_A03g015468 isoform B [Arachis hypogaea]